MDLNEEARRATLNLAEKFAKVKQKAGLGLRHAAGQIAEDVGKGAAILNDPRNAWIGTNPVGRIGAEGLGLTSALFGILAGPKAKTANHALLNLAKDLEKEGVGQRDIWAKTGWFQGPDGKWRYEISDHAAKIDESVPRSKLYPENLSFGLADVRPLDKTLNHPELYEAYPELRDVPVRGTGFNFDLRGAYNQENPSMFLQGNTPEKVRSTALHESQHAVQGIEGTAPGGMPAMFLSGDFNDMKAKADSRFSEVLSKVKEDVPGFNYFTVYRALNARASGKTLMKYEQAALDQLEAHPMARDFYEALQQKQQLDAMSSEAIDKYRALADETKARLVQARQDMTPAERAKQFPPDQYDVPPARQIVREK